MSRKQRVSRQQAGALRLSDEELVQVDRAVALVKMERQRLQVPYSRSGIARELLLNWSAEVIAEAESTGTQTPVTPDT